MAAGGGGGNAALAWLPEEGLFVLRQEGGREPTSRMLQTSVPVRGTAHRKAPWWD